METGSSLAGARRARCLTGLFRQSVLLSVFALLASLALAGQSFAQILGTGNLNVERRGHTATLLEDGKILIAGGENAQGPIGQAEIFDPVSRTSAFTPGAAAPRTDHTATRLSDGRVLIGGGRNQVGQMDSTEIYSPLTGSFIAGPPMMRARSGHTATMFSNGKILIAGGDAMGSAELYDPASQSFALVAGSMNKARTFHGAALLNNGQVLIAGGMDAQSAPLNTAELFDPQSQSFYQTINDMGMPRAFALMRVLPDGKVQIIGGDAEFSMEVFDPQDGLFNGVALLPPNASLLAATLSTHSRAALISPEIVQDALLQSVLTPEHLALLDRADHSITEIPQSNQALVAGGLKSSGQVLSSATLVKSSSATITTDKTDYAPGQIVTINGAGFLPSEQVDIHFHEFPDEYPDISFNVTADQQGKFITAEFAPQIIDIDRTFTLTAIGKLSGFTAQTVFTDGNSNVSVIPTSVGVTAGGVSVAFTIRMNVQAAVGSGGSFTVNTVFSISGGVCTGSNPVTTSVNSQTGTGNTNYDVAASVSAVSGQATATVNCAITPSVTNPSSGGVIGNPGSANLTVNVTGATAATTTTVDAATATYGDSSVTLNATVTSTSTVNVGTVTFTVKQGATTIGSPTTSGTVTGGAASVSYALPAGTNASNYTIEAVYSGGTGFNGSSGSGTLNINKANQTISFTTAPPASATFNTSFTVVATATSGLAVSYSAAGVCSNVDGLYTMTSGTGTCTVKVDQAGDANYNPAPQLTQNVTAEKANQTISFTTAPPASATFNMSFTVVATATSGLAVSYSAAGVCSNVDGLYTMTSGTGTCTVKVDQAGDANYNPAPQLTQNVTAEKANQTISFTTAPPASATFNTSFTVVATATSGLAVSYSAAGVCSNVDGLYTMTSGTGTCTVKVDQAGDANYNPAPQLTQNVTAEKANQTISFTTAPPGSATFNTSFTVVATATSGLAVSYSAAGVCSNVDGLYTMTSGTGTCTVKVDQAGDANYNPAPQLTQNVTAEKANAIINVVGYTGVYDGLPHGATGSAVGVLAEDLSASLNLGSSFTLVPGGTAYWTFSGGANYNDANGSVEIVITTAFAFNGFHAPIGGSVENGNGGTFNNPVKTFKLGSTIPVKFGATWLNGGAALITGIHKLQAVKYSNATTEDGLVIDATPTDAATTGNEFRLTGTDWHFNLSTKGAGFKDGTWLLIATLQDGSTHTVWITIKK